MSSNQQKTSKIPRTIASQYFDNLCKSCQIKHSNSDNIDVYHQKGVAVFGSMVFMAAYAVMKHYDCYGISELWIPMSIIKSVPAQYLSWSINKNQESRKDVNENM